MPWFSQHIPDLTPFWNSSSGFWASSGTTTTAGLNYTYPEFNNLNMGDTGAVQRAIANYINKQYGGSRFASFAGTGPGVSFLAQPAAGEVPPPVAQGASPIAAAVSAVKSTAEEIRSFASRGGHPHTAEKGEPGREGSTVIRDWTVRIHFKKYELHQSFAVLIFLGQVPDESSQWRTSPTFVGAHVAFINSAANQCANCQAQADVVSEGFVHLNSAIAKCSGLSSYEPDVVAPYLRENLHWRVQSVSTFRLVQRFMDCDLTPFQVDRSPIALDTLPSLEVTVSSTLLTHEPGSVFPIAGEPQYHHHITHGRQGGARHAQA